MKFAPWILSAVLAILLAAIFVMKSNQLDLVNQLAQKEQQLTQKGQQLDALQKQYDQLSSQHTSFVDNAAHQLSQAGQIIQTASQPEVQVSVTTRPAMLGSGLVAVVENDSGSMLAITVVASRPSTGQSRSFDFVMNARARTEIGHIEGWAFVNGDTVTVSQPNHKSRLFTL